MSKILSGRRSLAGLFTFLVTAALAGMPLTSASAASGSIFIVTDNPELEQGADNLGGYLRSLGYTVTVDEGNGAGAGPSNYRTMDAGKVAFLETFDLVVVHRATSSGSFAEGTEPTQWNNLDVPLLLGSAYLARNSPLRWDWAVAGQTRATAAEIVLSNPTHPIVAGLGSDLFTIARDIDHLSSLDMGNGEVVATVGGTGTAIAVWDNPGPFIGGSGQSHSQRRVFFSLLRYHEADGGAFSDYSANGLDLVANAVAYAMTGSVVAGAPQISDLSPADGTGSYNPAAGLSFRVSSAEEINPGDVTLTLNAVDVSAALVFSGDPTNRAISYAGLVGETAYTGEIAVINGLGSDGVSFSFDTFNPDLVAPVIQSVVPAQGATINSLTQITVVFSEPVVNVSPTDLFVGGNAAVSVSGSGATYTFVVDQPVFGSVTISFDLGTGIQDQAAPPNPFDPAAPSATWGYTLVDIGEPTADVINPLPGGAVQSLTQIEVTFSEPVNGVDAADLIVGGVPAASVSGAAAGPYVFQIVSNPVGLVTVEWAADTGIEDVAVIPNAFAGGSWTYTVNPELMLAEVRINEFLAATLDAGGLRDEFGELEDWIELYNFGAVPVDLTGYALTDAPNNPGKWVFPAVVLGPGEYLVVFASGRDRREVGGTNRLATNFKLSSVGNYLALFNAESPRQVLSEFTPEYPEQRNDHSYGNDSADVRRYFETPTPGAVNGDSSILGVVPAPHLNVNRGCFDAPFSLYLNTDLEGAIIRYTTDGSEPTMSNGAIYSGPVVVDKTTVLRAAAFKTGYLPSTIETHTYLFLEQVLRQPNDPAGYPTDFGDPNIPADYEMDPEIVDDPVYAPLMMDALKALPSMSVVINHDDMFGPTRGIYTHSTQRDNNGLWERPCSIELVYPDGSRGFQVNAGIQMQGNANRNPNNQPKHAFRLLFKGIYGPGKLRYKLFPDSPVDEFNTIVLRADYNNSWLHWDAGQRLRAQRTRDAYIKQRLAAMGAVSMHTRFVHLYINGLYWGVYDPTERPDGDFAASYFGGESEDYDAYDQGINQSDVVPGVSTSAAYNTMLSISGLADNAQYELMKQYLDMTQFIDYMLVHIYCANRDWGATKNWSAFRRRVPGAGFVYVPWDGERILESQTTTLANLESEVGGLPSGLHTKLDDNAEYRLEFADRVHKHFFNGGELMPDQAIAGWMKLADQMFPAIIGESARWGDYRRDVHVRNGAAPLFDYFGEFLTEQNRLVNTYFPARTGNVLNDLRNRGLYPATTAPTFNQHGGDVGRGFSLTMTGGTGVTYYTTDGSDPRVYGTGAVSGSAQLYSSAVVLNSSVVVKARAVNGGVWSALNEAAFSVDSLRAPLRITEIMYNPVGGDIYEFVEIQNISGAAVNVGNFYLTGITYIFPANTLLQPGQIIVLGSDNSPAAFNARYPGLTVFGRFSGNLANGGEKLSIKNSFGQTVVSVDYRDGGGWPREADGSGASLEIIDADGDPDAPANWRASLEVGGTPGLPVDPPAAGAVLINELMADNVLAVNNAGTHPDWVELSNPGPTPIDLEGWSLTDDGNERKFVFGSGVVLSAGGYLTVWCDTNTFAPGLHTGFALDRQGESVVLYDASTTRVDVVTYGVQLPDLTVGRVNGEWVLTTPTPDAPNVARALGAPASLRINEWLADPVPGADDWVELYNTDSVNPVSLQGGYITTSNAIFQIQSLSFVGPGGFIQLIAESDPGADQLDLTLPAASGAIGWHDATGGEVDRVIYGPQVEGVSEGRLPDGASSIVAFPGSASPEASNYLLSYNGPVLNEIMARNQSAVMDSAGRTVDWVELYNPNATPFDMAGMRLSENRGQASQWVFPAGTSIPAEGYLLVWFDAGRPASVSPEADLNQGFPLDGNSDGVYLFNAAGQLVDQVEYGFQIVDQSIGLSGSVMTLLEAPTPGALNSPAALLGGVNGLRINEWLASPGVGPMGEDLDDWFELFSVDANPVALEGVVLTDDVSVHDRLNTVLPPLSYIAPFGFVQLLADGSAQRGRNHVNFNLDGAGEMIGVYDSDLKLIDSVFFGRQTTGVSQGRLPDGGLDVIPLSELSPAAPNSLLAGPPLFIQQPEDRFASEGEDVEFQVRAIGQGGLTFQWYYNGFPLAGQTGMTLFLSGVVAEQQGEYYAVAASEHGQAASESAFLSVEAPPSFVVQPLPVSVVEGGTAVFSVVTRGTLPMGYRWRRGGATVAFGDFFDNVNHLVLNNVTAIDAGLYSVIITNSVFFSPGVLSARVLLTVLTDSDGDLMSDDWENDNGFNPNDPSDAGDDPDGDGLSNREEHEAGTDPRDAGSRLEVLAASLDEIGLVVMFNAVSNRSYTLQCRDAAGEGVWNNAMNVMSVSTNRVMTLTSPMPLGATQRYYRLVTPLQP